VHLWANALRRLLRDRGGAVPPGSFLARAIEGDLG
jgi:hypothetical protein